ncbi:MAG: YbbR-like domain-containing protein [Treponema sp.]|nr:YbbR-like domain-containing protein [Treponema sp.]
MSIKKFREKVTENFGVKIICIVIAVFIFFFHELFSLETKTLAVQLDLISQGKMAVLSGLDENPFVRISIRGKKDEIASISENDIDAFVDISTASAEGTFEFPVLIKKDARLAKIETLEIRIHPEKLKLTLDTVEEKFVDIVPNVTGTPAYGYESVGFSVSPSRAKIKGAASFISAIDSVRPELIDITGAEKDVVKSIRLVNPNRKLQLEPLTAEVTAKIRPKGLTRAFNQVVVNFTNVKHGFEIENDYAAVDVIVEGDTLTLEKLSKTAIILNADCLSADSEGTFVVAIEAVLPNGVKLVSMSSDEIHVNVRKKYQEENQEFLE